MKPRAPAKSPRPAATAKPDLDGALAALRRHASKSTRDGMARFGLPSDHALGVPMNKLLQLAKQLGPDHALALALWASGVHEARLLASLVDDPAAVTPAQMDGWCADFDNWGVVDTVCFKLFDRTPHAFAKVDAWHDRRGEFQKRAAFALLASLALHDRVASDDAFLRRLPLIERAASDERNFVKKGVSWALRAIGQRNAALNAAAVALARRLADSTAPASPWVGRDALRELTSAAVQKRIRGRAAAR